jgi:hypothetical protein
MTAIFYFLLFLVSFWENPTAHEFHVSKTLVEHNAESKSLEISMHIFVDDLELALEKIGGKELRLGSDKENPKAEELLVKYLNQQFQLLVNGKSVKFSFIGKELSEDFLAVWCYLEVEGITNLNSLKVTNTVLTEMFPDQKNVVQIKGPNQKKGYFLMDKVNNQETLTF